MPDGISPRRTSKPTGRVPLDELIAMQREARLGSVHLLSFDADGFCLAHTDMERAQGTNTRVCLLHQWLAAVNAPPADPPGVYVMVLRDPAPPADSDDPWDLIALSEWRGTDG